MAAMSLQKNTFKELLVHYAQSHDEIHFVKGDVFSWSPKTATITYSSTNIEEQSVWSLLHEIAHAKLQHFTYNSDFELLKLEVAAWKHAVQLAHEQSIIIDQDHIEDCLDTYRDWLHQRSTCPTCGTAGLQHSSTQYRCHNCNSSWTVSNSRFCRPYRRKNNTLAETEATKTIPISFH